MQIDKRIFLIAGPLLFVVLQLLGTPEGMPEPAHDVLSATIWIALWWVTEAVPYCSHRIIAYCTFSVNGSA